MVVVEMREAAYNEVFELLDEMKELGKKKRMVMCELEDAIYNCYEASKNDDEYAEAEEGQYDDLEDENDLDINFRRNRNMRRSMRNMRMRHNDEYENEDGVKMRGYRSRSNMRRRGRM